MATDARIAVGLPKHPKTKSSLSGSVRALLGIWSA